MECGPLTDDFRHDARIANFVGSDTGKVICGHVTHAVARGLDGVHLHGGELGEDLGHVCQLRPVELQVLARGKVAVAAVVAAREVVERAQAKGISVRETDDLGPALAQSDVVYMTRIQRERFADPAEYDRLKDAYVLTRATLGKAKPSITVMHPLPRVNEISTDVDDLPGAAYFRQSANGVPVRMALLALLLG